MSIKTVRFPQLVEYARASPSIFYALSHSLWDVLTNSVLNDKRKPIGYLDVKAIKSKFEKGAAGMEDRLGGSMTTADTPQR